MKYTLEQQAEAIIRAAKRLNLDSHLITPQFKKDLHTWADRIAQSFFRKFMPIKQSYMKCNSLDMDFFFTKDGTAIYTYAGHADSRDANEERIIKAFRLANKMREYMQEEIEKLGDTNETNI